MIPFIPVPVLQTVLLWFIFPFQGNPGSLFSLHLTRGKKCWREICQILKTLIMNLELWSPSQEPDTNTRRCRRHLEGGSPQEDKEPCGLAGVQGVEPESCHSFADYWQGLSAQPGGWEAQRRERLITSAQLSVGFLNSVLMKLDSCHTEHATKPTFKKNEEEMDFFTWILDSSAMACWPLDFFKMCFYFSIVYIQSNIGYAKFTWTIEWFNIFIPHRVIAPQILAIICHCAHLSQCCWLCSLRTLERRQNLSWDSCLDRGTLMSFPEKHLYFFLLTGERAAWFPDKKFSTSWSLHPGPTWCPWGPCWILTPVRKLGHISENIRPGRSPSAPGPLHSNLPLGV